MLSREKMVTLMMTMKTPVWFCREAEVGKVSRVVGQTAHTPEEAMLPLPAEQALTDVSAGRLDECMQREGWRGVERKVRNRPLACLPAASTWPLPMHACGHLYSVVRNEMEPSLMASWISAALATTSCVRASESADLSAPQP
jgi:hypothetical protein